MLQEPAVKRHLTGKGFLGGTISPGPRGGRHSSCPSCRSKPRGPELRLLLAARGSEPPRPVTFQASGMFSALQSCLFNMDPTQGWEGWEGGVSTSLI